MSVKIGFVTSQYFMRHVKALEDEFSGICDLIYFPYTTVDEILEIYESNCRHVDGFLFSGKLLFKHFQSQMKQVEKPCFYLSITPETFYKDIVKRLLQEGAIDFSRVFIDFVSESNQAFAIPEVFGKDKKPFTFESRVDNLRDNLEMVLEKHLALFESNQIDFAFSSLGEIVVKLNERNLPVYFVMPSKSDILQSIQKSAKEIELIKLKKHKIVIANVRMAPEQLLNVQSYGNAELKFINLYEALVDYGNLFDVNVVLQRHSLGYEMIVFGNTLEKFTNNYQNCTLLDHLEQKLLFPVHIGWSEGTDIYAVRNLAEKAAKIASQNEERASFIMTENGDVIEALSEESFTVQYSNAYNPVVDSISARTKLSALTIQKILGIMKKLDRNQISSEDLANHLRITVRSANRILQKLTEARFAKIVHVKQENLKGRPKRIYELDFTLDATQ